MKLPSKIAILGFLLLLVGGYFYSRAVRYSCIVNSMVALGSCAGDQDFRMSTDGFTRKIASQYSYTDAKKKVTITGLVYDCTNKVAIGDTGYHCDLALSSPAFHGAGVLAITTNRIFIWLDKSGGAKIIDEHYTPSLIPWRF